MSNIRKCSDSPTIFSQTKVTIVNGNIQRKLIWKDTIGHEYEKINGKFKIIPKAFSQTKYDYVSNYVYEQENGTNILAICCVISVITMIFLFGIAVGSLKSKDVVNKNPEKIIIP